MLRHFKGLTLVYEGALSQTQRACARQTCHTRCFTDGFTPFPQSIVYPKRTSKGLHISKVDEILSNLTAKKKICGFDIVHAFSVINSIYRKFQNNEKEKENSFQKLIPILEQHEQELTGKEALKVFGILCYNDFPQNRSVYRSLINHIVQHLDDLTAQEWWQICSSVQYMGLNIDIKERLSNALAQEIEAKLSATMHQEFEFLLKARRCTATFSNQQMYHGLIEVLLEKLCSYPEQILLEDAVSIILSLAFLQHSSPSSKNLHLRIQNEIIEQAHSLDGLLVKRIASSLGENDGFEGNSIVYCEKFFDAMIQKVISDDMGWEISAPVASRLNGVMYKSQELMNYCCASFPKIMYRFRNDSPNKMKHVETFICLLGTMNIIPECWADLQSCISESREILNMSHARLIHFTTNLLILNWCPTHLLEKVFDGSIKCSDSTLLSWRFCKIYQKLKSDPSYNGPMPTHSQLQALDTLVREFQLKFYPSGTILSRLKKGISNPLCIRSNISTRLFHIIDFVVAFHEDGTPAVIATKSDDLFNGDSSCLEDLEVPLGCQMILIIVMPRYWHFTNTKEAFGEYVMYTESLEKTYNYPVVVVKEGMLESLPDDEKTTFLMNEIRSKLESPVPNRESID